MSQIIEAVEDKLNALKGALNNSPITQSVQKLPIKAEDHLVLVVDGVDGRGDLKHFKAFFEEIRCTNPDLKLAAIIGGWASNSAYCYTLIDFLDKYGKELSEIQICINTKEISNGKKFEEMDTSYKNLITEKLINPYKSPEKFLKRMGKNVAIILQVSCSVEFAMQQEIPVWLETKRFIEELPYVFIGEYGAPPVDGELHHFSMGLYARDSGVRVIKKWQGPITPASKAAELLQITNKPFLHALLNQENPDLTDAMQYIDKRRLFSGHCQSETSYTLFIMTQIVAFLDLGQGLDFYLPEKHLNKQIIIELLNQMGVQTNDIAFINNESTHFQNHEKNELPKIRFFTDKDFELDDLSYEAVCYAGASVACSGDDSWTIAFSTSNIPFYIESYHYWKPDFRKSMLDKLESLECGILIEYLNIFTGEKIDFSSGGYKMFNASLKIFLLGYKTFEEAGKPYAYGMPNDPKTLSEVRKTVAVLFAKKMGEFIKANFAVLTDEMKTFRNHLYKSCNIFNILPSILTEALMKGRASNTQSGKNILPQYVSKSTGNAKNVNDKESLEIDQIKDFLSNQLSSDKPKKKWMYASNEKKFFLTVSNEKTYKQLLQEKGLAGVISIQKKKDKNEYCLITEREAILTKVPQNKTFKPD